MTPDFKKNTIDTVAKRAGFICSNPDCRVLTTGPNSEPSKATVIGEAAHIYGARPDSKRYNPNMTDNARAEITNAIWLCRNCHKLIDSDESQYSSEILFRWRELHEKYVLSELGNKGDLIRNEELESVLEQLKNYPAIIKRIVIDKPDGWEWRLTAELMRFLNKSNFRKLKDLRNNLYLKPQNHIVDEDEAFNWIQLRLTEASNLIPPLVNLIDQLNKSWGEPGQAGDIDEIHHMCKLIQDYTEQIVQYEELIRFTNVPEEYEKLRFLLQDKLSSQVLKIESIPDKLDEFVTYVQNTKSSGTKEEPETIHETINIELPENWESEFSKELQRVAENKKNFR